MSEIARLSKTRRQRPEDTQNTSLHYQPTLCASVHEEETDQDDAFFVACQRHAIVRRYADPPAPIPTHTVVRVAKHQGPPPTTARASRPTIPSTPQPQKPTKPVQKRLHWLFMWVVAW